MQSPVVLATGPLDDYAEQVLSRFGEYRVAPDMREATLVAAMPGVIALAVRGSAPVTEAMLAVAPDLKVIGRSGVGYDTIDVAAATRRKIPIVYTPGAGSRAVGEAAMAFMLALCKLVTFWDGQLKAGNWKSRLEAQGRDLDGQVLGILGFGQIGRILAEMAKPFGMTVIAHDPFVSAEQGAGLCVRMVTLDELVRSADFLSIHAPLTPETKGLIGPAQIAAMKPSSYLINLARGGLIDGLDILDEALVSGHLAGVALDVFDPAPPDIAHPLFRHPNCLTSPHAMATTRGAMTRIFRSMADDMATFLTGGQPRFVVNPEVLAG